MLLVVSTRHSYEITPQPWAMYIESQRDIVYWSYLKYLFDITTLLLHHHICKSHYFNNC